MSAASRSWGGAARGILLIASRHRHVRPDRKFSDILSVSDSVRFSSLPSRCRRDAVVSPSTIQQPMGVGEYLPDCN